MTTAKAIAALRQHLGLTQQQFADRLGLTVRSVARYESGHEPSESVLKQLLSVADETGVDDLKSLFEAKRRAAIASRNRNLPSSGTQRRVSVDDLESWKKLMQFTANAIGLIADRLNQEVPGSEETVAELNRAKDAAVLAENDIRLYLSGSTKIRPSGTQTTA